MSAMLPLELQFDIFESAARDDCQCALNLLRVSQYVNKMAIPILYEHIVLKNNHAAVCLLHTVEAYPCNHFQPKSLLIFPDIPSTILRPIFAKLSKSVLELYIHRNSTDSDPGLDAIQSPCINDLALIYADGCAVTGDIPIDVLPSVKRLALKSEFLPMCEAINLSLTLKESATILRSIKTGTTKFLCPFRTLTHLAVPFALQDDLATLMKMRLNRLQCCALLLSESDNESRGQFIMIVKSWRDPRVVVLTDYTNPRDWHPDNASSFWTRVEKLITERCVCDDGERWDETIVNDFRQKYPHIALLESL